MTEWTCEQVEPLLDLDVAGECEPAEHAAVAEHLERCPKCAAAWSEARRVRDLLDLHYQAPARLKRLHKRLRQEALTHPRARILSLAQRFGALAALLLVTLGLALLLGPIGGEPSPSLVMTVAPARFKAIPEHVQIARNDFPLEKMNHPAAAMKQLQTLAQQGKLPPAPRIDQTLTVRNTQLQPITLFPGGSGTNLHLDVTGPGVARSGDRATTGGVVGIPLWHGQETVPQRGPAPAFLSPERIVLPPGGEYVFSLPDLTDGSRGSLRRQYCTEPGDYEVRIRYRVGWSRGGDKPEGFLQLRAGPVWIHVPQK